MIDVSNTLLLSKIKDSSSNLFPCRNISWNSSFMLTGGSDGGDDKG